jgi:hypothetical protein
LTGGAFWDKNCGSKESMAFRLSSCSSGVALLSGGVACCLLPWRAGAGDRIEFSSPAFSWVVPQREVEQRERKTPNTPVQSSAFEPPETVPAYETPVVIVTRSRDMDKRAWDSHTLDPTAMPDKDKRSISAIDRFFHSDSYSSETETNNNGNAKNGRDGREGDDGRDGRDGRDYDSSNNSTSRRYDEKSAAHGEFSWKDDDSMRFGREKDGKEEHLGDQYSQEVERERKENHLGDQYVSSLANLPWMKSAGERDSNTSEQTQHGDLVQFSGGFGNAFESGPGGSGAADGLMKGADPLRGSSLPTSSLPEYSPLGGSQPSPSGGLGQIFGAPAMTPAWDSESSAPAASFGISIPSPAQPWSGVSQRQEAPATLPFPHKPGDPFQ